MSGLVKSIIAGAIGGVIGAVVWAVIAFQFHLEIGYIAWGVGILVGVLARLGAGDDPNPVTGAAAAVIAIAALCAGKYAAISAMIDGAVNSIPAEMLQVTDEVAISYIARDVENEYRGQGKPVNKPEDWEEEDPWSKDVFAADVWADATGRWNAAGAAWQADYRHWVDQKRRHEIQEMVSSAKEEGFFETFSLFDILFFGLAIVSAYGIASGAGTD